MDTGPLYALADPSDQFHERAHQELARMEGAGWQVVIPYAVLYESYTLVMRRLGTAYALQWLDQVIMTGDMVNPEPVDYVNAAAQVTRFPDQSITLVDAVTAVLAARLNASVWAFDRHFQTMRTPLWQ